MSGHYLIGCSDGSGNQWKILPAAGGTVDSSNGILGQLCNDQPNLWSNGCQNNAVKIYIREQSNSGLGAFLVQNLKTNNNIIFIILICALNLLIFISLYLFRIKNRRV